MWINVVIMYLTRLIYVSTITQLCRPESLDEILMASRKHNKEDHITGILSFDEQYFLQCLEGSRAKVNEAYSRIHNDKRHSNVIILDYEEISSRVFGDWSMGYVPKSKLTGLLNIQFSGSDSFTPYEMSGASAFQMLLELKKNLPSD